LRGGPRCFPDFEKEEGLEQINREIVKTRRATPRQGFRGTNRAPIRWFRELQVPRRSSRSGGDMRRFLPHAVAIVVVMLAAQGGAQPGSEAARAAPGAGERVYDPSTVGTVTGEVVSVERSARPGRGGGGVHLLLRTDSKDMLSVRLGPAAYVERQAMKIASGDRVEVKGSRVTVDGESFMVAAEVTKGDQKLLLRHPDGVPYWSGGRRGGPR
jgi:hypothetical protein